VYFNAIFRIDEEIFEILTDEEGDPVLDEEFTETLRDFSSWALGQEATLQRLFLKET
jgi:type I restriction enzyme M protein